MEDEWGPIRFKIKGHVANMGLLTGPWDTFAGRAFLGLLHFHSRVQVFHLPTHIPSLTFPLETHFWRAHVTEVLSLTTRWSHCTEGSAPAP